MSEKTKNEFKAITNVGSFYPLWIRSLKYEKLLVVQSEPEKKYWFKDKEIEISELIEILEKQ